jgi:hypothetical protein
MKDMDNKTIIYTMFAKIVLVKITYNNVVPKIINKKKKKRPPL